MPENHGMTGTPEHRAWKNMKTRCSNPNTGYHHRYGARGITVCPEWRDSFERFFADVGVRPTSGHTLERVDNDRGYEAGNVRWATRREQAQNRETNRRLTLDGVTRTLAQWPGIVGVKEATIYKRLKLGWTVEAALSTPVRSRD
jgi:hypothetical protein